MLWALTVANQVLASFTTRLRSGKVFLSSVGFSLCCWFYQMSNKIRVGFLLIIVTAEWEWVGDISFLTFVTN